MVKLLMTLLSSSIKLTSLHVDMFLSKSDAIPSMLGFRNKSCTCNWIPNVSFISPITLAANNECLKIWINIIKNKKVIYYLLNKENHNNKWYIINKLVY